MNKIESIFLRLSYARVRAKNEGLVWVLTELIMRGWKWTIWMLLVPIALVGHIIGYRRVPVITHRIGHLAAELDCFLKLKDLGRIKTTGRRFFVVAHPRHTANSCLLDYWAANIYVIRNPVMCRLVELITHGPMMRHDISNYVLSVGKNSIYGEISSIWDGRAPLLRLMDRHREEGISTLKRLGISEGSWYVCFHAREDGYSPGDAAVHSYRNVKIETMILAMKEITERGGWCIRVGDPTMSPLPAMERVIDYAHHDARSDNMDIFLAATCRFFVGNTSGLFLVSTAFGVPSALTNMIPYDVQGFLPSDLNIFKLIRDKKTKRTLTYREILSTQSSSYRATGLFEESSLEIIDNTQEEIQELVVEMIDRLCNEFQENEIDIHFRGQLRSLIKPSHYCYLSKSRIATTFIRRHPQIFA